MKTKLLNIWHNLGINAKAIIIMVMACLGILLFACFFSLLFLYGEDIYPILIILPIVITFRQTKQWLQQNKEN